MSTFNEDMTKPRLFGRNIEDTYEIGGYQFIETVKDGTSSFHCYIDGKSIGYFADSLDAALIVAIAHKYDGLNSQAAHYFARMIGMDK